MILQQLHILFSKKIKVVLILLLLPVIAYTQEHLKGVTKIETDEYKSRDTTAFKKFIDEVVSSWPAMSADSAIRVFEYILAESELTQYAYGIGGAILNLTALYSYTGQYAKGVATLQHTMHICRQSEHLKRQLPLITNCLATMYQAQGNYQKAVYYYYEAMLSFESYDVPSMGGVYSNLGELLLELKQYQQALYFLNIAEKMALRHATQNNRNGLEVLGYVLVNKSILYASQKNFNQSEWCATVALQIARKYDFLQLKYFSLISLGNVYISKNMPEKALAFISEAGTIKTGIDVAYQNTALRISGEAYYKLHNYDKAERSMINALNDAQTSNLGNGRIETHRLLSKIYIEKQQYKQALEHYQKYIQIKDSLSGLEATKNVAQLEIKYMTAEKDRELIQKELLITQQQKWIAGITASTLALLVLLVIIYNNYRHRQRFQHNQMQILQQGQQIDRLKAIMEGEEKERTRIARDLHDGIGGMLASIKMNLGLIKKENPELTTLKRLDDAIYMLQDTSTEVRKTAHNLMPDVLIRHSLKKALEIYCDNISTNSILEIDLQFHGDFSQLNKAAELILYRFVQELIQNVIKHANATYTGVQIIQQDDKLNIIVEDNGSGFEVSDDNGGYGLQNMRFRIQTLQGKISIMSAKGKNTTVYIEFDYQKLLNNTM